MLIVGATPQQLELFLQSLVRLAEVVTLTLGARRALLRGGQLREQRYALRFERYLCREKRSVLLFELRILFA